MLSNFSYRISTKLLLHFFIITIVGLFMRPGVGLFAETTDNIQNNINYLNLSPHIEMYVDKTRKQTLTDVTTEGQISRFSKNSNDNIDMPLSKGAIWIRFNIHGIIDSMDANFANLWILEFSKTDFIEIDLFAPIKSEKEESSNGSVYDIQYSGMNRAPLQNIPFSDKPILSLPVQLNLYEYIYIRLTGHDNITCRLNIWPLVTYQRRISKINTLVGALFGACICLVIYNFFIYLYLREQPYLYYSLYVLFAIIFIFYRVGYGQFIYYLKYDSLFRLVLFTQSFALLWIILFSKTFLNINQYSAVFNKLLNIFCLPCLVGVMISLLPQVDILTTITYVRIIVPIGILLSIFAGILAKVRGFRPAIFYLISFLASAASILVYVLVLKNIVKVSFPGQLIMLIGINIDAALLSFALAYRIQLLREEKKLLKTSANRFKRLSEIDGLTQIYNKAFLFENLNEYINSASKTGQWLSIIILDVDNFKKFNDTYGHPEGDKVLVGLSQTIKSNIRKIDLPCRYGGEEFVVILPGTDTGAAYQVSERIRLNFSGMIFKPAPGFEVTVTLSLGVARYEPHESQENFIKRADCALYKAKSMGKNQTVVF